MIGALSLATIMVLAIAIACIALAFAPIRVQYEQPKLSDVPQKKKDTPKIAYPYDAMEGSDEFILALKVQAKRQTIRRSEVATSGVTYFEWLNECIKHLRTLWHDCSYEEAKAIIESSLDFWGMNYPSAEYEWTPQSARDVAIEISHDGELYGANE